MAIRMASISSCSQSACQSTVTLKLCAVADYCGDSRSPVTPPDSCASDEVALWIADFTFLTPQASYVRNSLPPFKFPLYSTPDAFGQTLRMLSKVSDCGWLHLSLRSFPTAQCPCHHVEQHSSTRFQYFLQWFCQRNPPAAGWIPSGRHRHARLHIPLRRSRAILKRDALSLSATPELSTLERISLARFLCNWYHFDSAAIPDYLTATLNPLHSYGSKP